MTMDLLTSLKARAARDPEFELGLLRLVLVGMVFPYVALIGSSADVKIAVASYLAVAIGIFAAICVWPAANPWRRFVGMILDVSGITLFVRFAGPTGVMAIGIYLWVIFGNGFRFGRRDLYLCQALCILGFIAALAYVPYWRAHIAEGVGLLTVLIVVPLYVSVLLQRIQEAHAKTEQTLRECLERERPAS
jgi:two-component system sensor histidine kinase RpfC